jgi:hypothetical protein
MMSARESEKVAQLDNEVQASLLKAALQEEDIPHVIVSYHDTAYDGLFQVQRGWGHVEAPPEYHERIREMMEELEEER